MNTLSLECVAKFNNMILLTESTTTTTTDTTELESLVKLIGDYGIMLVSSAILIIFSIAMFKRVMNANSTADSKLADAVTKSLDTLTTAVSSTMNISEVFDKHNSKTTTEFDNIKRSIKDLNSALEQIERQNENLLKMLDDQNDLLNDIKRSLHND